MLSLLEGSNPSLSAKLNGNRAGPWPITAYAGNMEHHPDFAFPIPQKLEVETAADPGDGLGPIRGRAIAGGWWVIPSDESDAPGHVPVGTLYLVVDSRRSRPMWVRQSDLTAVRTLD